MGMGGQAGVGGWECGWSGAAKWLSPGLVRLCGGGGCRGVVGTAAWVGGWKHRPADVGVRMDSGCEVAGS